MASPGGNGDTDGGRMRGGPELGCGGVKKKKSVYYFLQDLTFAKM